MASVNFSPAYLTAGINLSAYSARAAESDKIAGYKRLAVSAIRCAPSFQVVAKCPLPIIIRLPSTLVILLRPITITIKTIETDMKGKRGG